MKSIKEPVNYIFLIMNLCKTDELKETRKRVHFGITSVAVTGKQLNILPQSAKNAYIVLSRFVEYFS